jgi:DNA-binding winged helix-turn-helix (wHTH) protein/Tfp pilus assembly protein PilF
MGPPAGSTNAVQDIVRFGVFEADLRSGELRREGIKVRLQDLPFRALTHFVTHPGVVIPREEFRQALWPADVFVDFDQGISSAIRRLRDALGDSADNPIFIQTIERRGYRWIAPLHFPEAEIAVSAGPRVAAEAVSARRRISTRLLVYAAVVLALLILGIWVVRLGGRGLLAEARSNSVPHRIEHPTPNREAEDLYLKGRAYWSKRTPESLNQAVDAFTQAIVSDPNYSDAYVGLADCYNLLREFSVMPQNEAYRKAHAAAKRAVELDPQSSAAHTSLAFVTFWGMWDASTAEKEFRRALELDPNNAQAHHWFATFLHAIQRHDEALTEIKLARKLDPNSSATLADEGELLLAAGQRAQGMQVLRQLETADPNFASPHRYLRFAYFQDGDYPNYLSELRQDALLTHDPAAMAQADAGQNGFAKGGPHGMLEAELDVQKKMYEEGKLSAYYAAQSEARLGNKDGALQYLNLCVQAHDEHVFLINAAPIFAGYHDDPAFQQIVAQIKPSPAL